MTSDANSWAFFRRRDGKYIIARGPFNSLERPPEKGIAFYCDDFGLSDVAPWKVPAEVGGYDDLSTIASSEKLDLTWEEPSGEYFAHVFGEVHEAIRRGKLEKAVPVVVEKGEIKRGCVSSLLSSLESLPTVFSPYGFCFGDSGFIGATPEHLFIQGAGVVKTMALAGTARKEDENVFAVDDKEIREHEFVAGTLASTLSNIGMTKVHSRQILDLGALVHFQTLIEVELYRDLEPQEIIQLLHPTPALGTLPRTQATLELLHSWRAQLDCPSQFGAPFGLLEDGVFDCLVAIRGLHWQGEQVSVPAGCGVIDESRLVNEWRELRLKRESVKTFLGV